MTFVPLKNYAADRVVVTFKGHIFGGYASGSFVKVGRSEDSFKKYVGADGSVSRARMSDKSGEVTITLAQTSPSNDFCTRTLKEDEELGTGYGPLMVKDLLGNTLAMSANAWIRKPPDQEFAAEISEREWTLDCERLDPGAGGAL